MTEQEKIYFSALTRDRSESADMLQKPSMRGIKNSVVDKYTDQAHFIYELLQNADDAGATSARFVLERKRLIFAHNGTRRFSVTDPAREEEDSKIGKLGDINSITSIANSNKVEASIGKFGVGFKAVFQYTATPRIYDPNIYFRIDRFIVPAILENDFLGRRADETLFVFPFDHKKCGEEQAYNEIADKLASLSNPILFLSNLRDIDLEIEDIIGFYGKNNVETKHFGDTTAEYITQMQNSGDDLFSQHLWLFSRNDDLGGKYSVGYFLDEDNKLLPINEPAVCFFPTKENTGLKFLVHAQFLLTDSREGIRAGDAHNRNMISLLAKLAADSLIYLREIGNEKSLRLIDDSILSIIPLDETAFTETDDKRRISFRPFFTEIKKKFLTEKIVPTRDSYCSSEDAYWAAVPQLTELFSDDQLATICGVPKAQWVFTSLGRDEVQRGNKVLFSYIEGIINTWLDENVLIKGRSAWENNGKSKRIKSIQGITKAFIGRQTVEWLNRFYKWISETSRRTQSIKQMPIFLDQNKKAVAAYDESDQLILFLPDKDISGCTTVNSELLSCTYTFGLLKKIGVKTPSIKDQIYNIILPQYKKGGEIDAVSHFLLFFKFYDKLPNVAVFNFIEMIKNYEFIRYYKNGDEYPYRGKAADLYFPSEELKEYFAPKENTYFAAFDEYLELMGLSKKEQLIHFLTDLGIKFSIAIIRRDIDYNEASKRRLPTPRSTRELAWSEAVIDGCKEILYDIVREQDKDKSVLLWNALLRVIETNCTYTRNLDSLLEGSCTYFYYSLYTKSFESSDALQLKTEKWLVNRDGNFVSADKISRNQLSEIYDTKSESIIELLRFLKISDKAVSEKELDDENLTDKQRERIELAKKAEELGLTAEDLEELALIKKQRESATRSLQQSRNTASAQLYSKNDSDSEWGEVEDCFFPGSGEKLNKRTSSIVKDIARRTRTEPSHDDIVDDEVEVDDVDEDEHTPRQVDYSKRIERAKQKSASEIDKIAYFEELQQRALDAEKYSFGWFNALLEMEALTSNTNNLNSKEVSISFSRVEREPGTQRTLVLKHPSRYIPQFMEDLADIPLILHFGEQKKTVAIEGANVKSYTLRVKLKTNVDIDGIDLSTVTEARIDAKSPVFLLEELRKQFAALDFKSDFNMQKNLCENIEFVFGPPGTGKTTHLARNVLIPMMREQEDLKVLVLTPTNKSADVLVSKIMEVMDEDRSNYDWLVRFGITNDEAIEASKVFRDKTFDIRSLKRNITVTTVARFPYDFFMPSGTRIFLNGIKWDYIVVDEASMIPIANIVYPLYKKTPRKFIIAGDPFQIEPITAIDLWKTENIYTMVHLDSFIEPVTVPYKYKVKLLTTQYRSVPAIGSIFSEFAYGGILKHHRSEGSRKKLNIENVLDIRAINTIKFPVSKYESIYRSKRLQHSSSYHIYAALFSFEFTSYLANTIAKSNTGSGKTFSIGIIAPYRAQADLVEKLMSSVKLPDSVDVQVGTIHGFQGDECDIIIAVFNTPPSISYSKEMFLNKRNIINVSISRARDYLFIVMPDDKTENISNLRLVKRVEQLAKEKGASEFGSHVLEELIFGKSTYLEENTFSTGHQSVNVYGLPEKCYEIRSEDSAVDVQVHRSGVPRQQKVEDKAILTQKFVPNEKPAVSVAEKEPQPKKRKKGTVFSRKYGEGHVVKRTQSSGKPYVIIQFESNQITFDEQIAIANKELTFY